MAHKSYFFAAGATQKSTLHSPNVSTNMGKIITILVLSLISLNIWGQKNEYPGLIHLSTGSHKIIMPTDLNNKFIVSNKYLYDEYYVSRFKSDTTCFNFYKDINDSSSIYHISFYFDWSKIPRKDKIIEENIEFWFKPMCFDIKDTISGYFDIYLTCKSKKGNWFEVVINEETQETLWIQKAKFVKLVKWDKLTKKKYWWFTIQKQSNNIYSKPDTLSTQIDYNGNDCFEITKVKNNWMKISNTNSELCGNYDMKFVESGWIRYKTNNGLLIKLNKE